MISFKALNSYQRFNMVLSENGLYQISHLGIKKIILFSFPTPPRSVVLLDEEYILMLMLWTRR